MEKSGNTLHSLLQYICNTVASTSEEARGRKKGGRAECDQNRRRTTSNISNTEGHREEEAATELHTEMTLAGKREAGSGDWGVGCRP